LTGATLNRPLLSSAVAHHLRPPGLVPFALMALNVFVNFGLQSCFQHALCPSPGKFVQ